MKRLLLAALLALAPAVAQAGGPMAKAAFAYATTPAQKAGAAFVTLATDGAPDRLLAAASPAAARVEIHTHMMEDGVMKMRPVDGPLPLSAETPIEMKPGGVHVMLMGLKAPLVAGETLSVTLIFETAGEVAVEAPIIARGETPPMTGGHGHGG